MLKSYKIEGFVIKRKNISETDKIITFFSKSQGKIIAIAKGIRRIQSRKAPHLELFNKVSAYLYTGRNFDIITEAQIIDTYTILISDIHRIACAYRIIEIINRLCPEREEHYVVYSLLSEALSVLNRREYQDYQDRINDFILKILRELGYLPKDKILTGIKLENFLENVMEQNLKSSLLLTKLK